ncbi:MAG TPA: amino acid permease [Bryobacteraceae bacterium]|nr:amino acid permease [Bryobacteraceae bacterium]
MTPTATPASRTPELQRQLGLFDAACIVVGTTIGVGIFLVPGSIARALPSEPLILAIWVITGLISFFGALGYAELGAMIPESGGQYVYVREAYGPLTAFLCGWVSFLIVQSGSIAAVSVGFGIYLSYVIPRVPGVVWWAPVAVIAFFTLVNYRGVRSGARTQNLFTALKTGGLVVLIASAFVHIGAPPAAAPIRASLSLNGVVIAMLGCFVAYDGWQYVAFVAGEIRDPRRNIPLSLGLGTGLVVLLYFLANVAYFRVLPLAGIAATEHVAATAAEHTLGPLGATLIALTIMFSSAGAANGAILTSPRLYYAQARDGLFFHRMAEVHPRFGAPSFAILVQGVWCSILAVSGSYETIVSYALFAMWLFHGMTVFGVIVLRRRDPERLRPYRMWGYPLAPLLFALFAGWLVVNTLVSRPGPSLAGTAIIAAGVPIYYIWKKRGSRENLPESR